MSTGASLDDIFEVITLTVMRKQYKTERNQERTASTRNDLEDALLDTKMNEELRSRVETLLLETELLPDDGEVLKRGEFIAGYRKFLKIIVQMNSDNQGRCMDARLSTIQAA